MFGLERGPNMCSTRGEIRTSRSYTTMGHGPAATIAKKKRGKTFRAAVDSRSRAIDAPQSPQMRACFPQTRPILAVVIPPPPKNCLSLGPMRCRGLPNGEILSVKLSANEDFAGNRDPCQRLWWIMDTRFFQGAYLGLETSPVQAASRACYSWRVVELAPSQDLPRLRERDS